MAPDGYRIVAVVTGRVNMSVVAVCVLAVAVRLSPLLLTGDFLNKVEYDGGVMLTATLRLVAGQAPYADFIYLHPPGSLFLFAPAAMLAGLLGDHVSLALLRVGIIALGAANTLLIGLLLRRFGAAAVLAGAGMYAVWPVVGLTERMVMLEPILNVCLLAALAIMRERRRIGGAWIAGVLLGIAISVKYWAVIDVVLIGLLVTARFGWRGLWRYLVAGAATVSILVVPFFARAPAEMWTQTVATQLTRPSTETTLPARLNMLSAFLGSPTLDDAFPWVVWAVFWLGLLILAGVPLFGALRARQSPREWPDPAWWGLIAVTHAVVLGTSAVFYDHYATWLVAPLALTTGVAVSRLRAPGLRRAVGVGAVVMMVVVAAPQLVLHTQTRDYTDIRVAAQGYDCVWASSDALIVADAASRGVASRCSVYVDLFGAELAAGESTTARESFDASIRQQLRTADGAMLSIDPELWPFSADTASWVRQNFEIVEEFGDVVLWARSLDR